jgi:hypothetical protein
MGQEVKLIRVIILMEIDGRRLYWRRRHMRAVKERERTACKRPIERAVIYSCSWPGRWIS